MVGTGVVHTVICRYHLVFPNYVFEPSSGARVYSPAEIIGVPELLVIRRVFPRYASYCSHDPFLYAWSGTKVSSLLNDNHKVTNLNFGTVGHDSWKTD